MDTATAHYPSTVKSQRCSLAAKSHGPTLNLEFAATNPAQQTIAMFCHFDAPT
ncbi:hypothetical protein A2U01_0018394 [Trifolium medium]|uniref:Uncharacterized protein n=1 Tax=Trifolium medium TaxID=97028 RepID=A0A392NDY1_9FABA|nr:hypothetical protein [Trifolium medium]